MDRASPTVYCSGRTTEASMGNKDRKKRTAKQNKPKLSAKEKKARNAPKLAKKSV